MRGLWKSITLLKKLGEQPNAENQNVPFCNGYAPIVQLQKTSVCETLEPKAGKTYLHLTYEVVSKRPLGAESFADILGALCDQPTYGRLE